MLWGVTLRSPHPSARILSVDITEALKTAGVFAVLTHDDVPGAKYYGLEHQDQPVLAIDVVRYQGEPIALVAADHPETARQAMKKIVVEYDVLEPIVDAEKALLPDSPRLHPDGNLVRHVKIRVGDPSPTAEVVVSGDYEVGMQDQAFLGPESGLAVPDDVGGVDLFVATQWLHADQRQVCSALGLGPDQVRLRLSGVGGAFGGREDLSMHVHGCLLALHTRKPVKMVYNREESFFGHVHRHPASMHYEYGADRDGKLVYARVTIHLDGGAYASSTPAVVGNAGTMGLGPTRSRTSTSTATAPTRTTRRAAPCAGSARCRPRSRSRRSWTSLPTRSASIPWRSGSATGSRKARRHRPGRSSTAPHPSPSWSSG